MTAINCHDTHERQIEVPLAELNDLELRMIPDAPGVGTRIVVSIERCPGLEVAPVFAGRCDRCMAGTED